MWRGLTLLIALLGLLGLAAPEARAAVGDVVAPGTERQDLKIEVNEGQLIRLQVPASAVFIANSSVADVNVKSARMIYVFGKSPGQTTLYALDAGDNVIINLRLRVSHNLSRLSQSISRLLPSGTVQAVSVADGIMLTGTVDNSEDAENLKSLALRFAKEKDIINRVIVTQPNQVNLRVRVAEVAHEVIKSFGFNWDNIAAVGNLLVGIATGLPIPGGSNSIVANYGNDSLDLNLFIDSLATDGLISTLAEPNLTSLSGETASFLAGGEFPIPVARKDNVVTVAFKEFGVSLAFTPTVLSSNRISMRVRPEVSQISTAGAVVIGGFQIPALTTRRAETTVEVASGQSFAIAGLMLDRDSHSISDVPGLSEIPILGRLFTSEQFQRAETELVIIVTPYLVRPSSDRSRIARPTDPLIEPVPQNTAFAARNRTRQTVPVTNTSRLKPGLVGPAGFIIE